MQIDRQIENFKKIYSQFDQKIKEQNQKFLALIDRKETEFEAGKFLVEQMTIIQDEKMDLLVENERLQKQIELIIWQNQESQAALDNYQEFFKLDDEKTQTIVRLKEKIDELEDFIEEIKEKG